MVSIDYVNDYIRKTIKKNDGILAELEDFAEKNHVPIVHPEVAALLKVMTLTLKPKKVLEIGTAIGYSSILISSVLDSDGKIDTIDRYELMINRAKDKIKKANLENTINILYGDALEVLKLLDKKYDMIFLDAAKGKYPEFLPQCLRLLRSGGMLISDNVLYKGMIANDELIVRRKRTIVNRLRNYLDNICNNEQLETSIIPIGDGVALSYKK
ncbi:O-methyltransferase [Herbivorax sp. ANBcel31]|uniref:O-methyltransferase n=1 Tax=Herbivorax sp. ANBcel31 TaxID=3069754 RepID=UPI0027AEE5AF|nr:O-methyltransferase [Herbivorax sp. ANBcel31]MDQ2086917.1 O-methyltransferase [Herbivorax sp. ANBcel31]